MYKYKKINDVDEYENTQLARPVIKGDVETVEKLLKKGCDPNIRNKGKFTPLHFAIKHKRKEIEKLLRDGGAK